jgi:hypothetical protein
LTMTDPTGNGVPELIAGSPVRFTHTVIVLWTWGSLLSRAICVGVGPTHRKSNGEVIAFGVGFTFIQA